MVVFPALSKPSTRILASFSPKSCKNLENQNPMAAAAAKASRDVQPKEASSPPPLLSCPSRTATVALSARQRFALLHQLSPCLRGKFPLKKKRKPREKANARKHFEVPNASQRLSGELETPLKDGGGQGPRSSRPSACLPHQAALSGARVLSFRFSFPLAGHDEDPGRA